MAKQAAASCEFSKAASNQAVFWPPDWQAFKLDRETEDKLDNGAKCMPYWAQLEAAPENATAGDLTRTMRPLAP
jgi:hypothetical protein